VSGNHANTSTDCGVIRRQEWVKRRQALLDRRPAQGYEEEKAWMREMKATWDRYGQHGLLGGMFNGRKLQDELSKYQRISQQERMSLQTELSQSEFTSLQRMSLEIKLSENKRISRHLEKIEAAGPVLTYDKASVALHMNLDKDHRTRLSELEQIVADDADMETVNDAYAKMLNIRKFLVRHTKTRTDWSKLKEEARADYEEVVGEVPLEMMTALRHRSEQASRNLKMFKQDFEYKPPLLSMEEKWGVYMESLTQADWELGSDFKAYTGNDKVMRDKIVKFHEIKQVYRLNIMKHYETDLHRRDSLNKLESLPQLGSDVTLTWAPHIPVSLQKPSNLDLMTVQPVVTHYHESIVHDARRYLQKMFDIFESYNISYAQATAYLIDPFRFVGEMEDKVRLHKQRCLSSRPPATYHALFTRLDEDAEPEVAFKQFKSACEFIIEQAVVIPSDDSINSILRYMVAGERNFAKMYDVWWASLFLDKQL
jgi:hypothetical protein